MNHLIPLLNVIISSLIFFFNYLITLGPGMMERRKWCDIMWKTIFTYFHVPIPFLWFLLITKYINELTRLMDSGKDSACQCRRCRFDPWVEKTPGEGNDMTTCSSILAWKLPWTEEPGGLQSMGSLTRLSDWAHRLMEARIFI